MAREHGLPYFDDEVYFPDVRIDVASPTRGAVSRLGNAFTRVCTSDASGAFAGIANGSERCNTLFTKAVRRGFALAIPLCTIGVKLHGRLPPDRPREPGHEASRIETVKAPPPSGPTLRLDLRCAPTGGRA